MSNGRSCVYRRTRLIDSTFSIALAAGLFLTYSAFDELIACYNHSGIGFLEPSPQGDIVVRNVDVVPVAQPMHRGVVQFVVEDCPAPIFNRILHCGKEKDDDQWDRAEPRVRITEYWENLPAGQSVTEQTYAERTYLPRG